MLFSPRSDNRPEVARKGAARAPTLTRRREGEQAPKTGGQSQSRAAPYERGSADLTKRRATPRPDATGTSGTGAGVVLPAFGGRDGFSRRRVDLSTTVVRVLAASSWLASRTPSRSSPPRLRTRS